MGNKDIVKAFWAVVPSSTTVHQLFAEGRDIKFFFRDKPYEINTRVHRFTSRSLDSCYKIVETRAVEEVHRDR